MSESINKKDHILSDQAIGIIGAGGQAREVAWYSESPIAFYAVDREFIKDSFIDIEKPDQKALEYKVVAAIGSPLLRKKMIGRWPGKLYARVVSSQSIVHSETIIGEGAQIAPSAVIMPGCVLGNHVIINIGVTISHDCQLEDYTTISPGAHIAGKVKLGAGVFVGIGATINNGVTIAAGCVVGAGAVVLDNVYEENSVVVGLPAKTIRHNESWLNEV